MNLKLLVMQTYIQLDRLLRLAPTSIGCVCMIAIRAFFSYFTLFFYLLLSSINLVLYRIVSLPLSCTHSLNEAHCKNTQRLCFSPFRIELYRFKHLKSVCFWSSFFFFFLRTNASGLLVKCSTFLLKVITSLFPMFHLNAKENLSSVSSF